MEAMCIVEGLQNYGSGCFWPLRSKLAKAFLLRIPLMIHMASLGNDPQGRKNVSCDGCCLGAIFEYKKQSPHRSLDVKRLLHTSGYCQLRDGK
jgi:hypothetical protein